MLPSTNSAKFPVAENVEPSDMDTVGATLVKTTFSMIRLPAVGGRELVLLAVAIPIGVLLMDESINVMEPTVCLPVAGSMLDMLRPVPQLLIVIDLYVQPQSQI